ncbi:MAG TPA: type II toxin-antitoxin system HicB family antitoxin [Chloroflexota bacterium]|nr:type II toxin-antitoxin system HicB family antitoxin [Chloroflexota bacterium]HUM71166.1 type II toxin-antitoxin system HicB family antitoxin [Chloroflexota bacterium]
MDFHIETEQETDGRWIAEITDIPGCMVYGNTPEQAIARVKALALRILADQLDENQRLVNLTSITFAST